MRNSINQMRDVFDELLESFPKKMPFEEGVAFAKAIIECEQRKRMIELYKQANVIVEGYPSALESIAISLREMRWGK